jgi:hypothetical protein
VSTHSSAAPAATTLSPERSRLLLQAAGAVLLIGLILCGAAWSSDAARFSYSYLTGFMFVITIGFGGLALTMLQHVTKAGWSVGVRRQMEWMAGILPLMLILFIPIALNAKSIWHLWAQPNIHTPGWEFIARKLSFLNLNFFFIRVGIYFAVWTGLSLIFRLRSLAQDKSGDPELTMSMQWWAPPGFYLWFFSVTFASFDWVMSLMPTWYSTIFGVYIIAGSTTSALASLAIMTLAIQKAGLGGTVSTVEHRHDIGKLLFGFTVFWAYIAFSQFFLIWYANIPEETIFYKIRWGNSWEPISYSLVFGHFWIPFFILLSRHVKRHPFGLALGATILLVMHYVDMYWLVMPNFDKELHFSWIDLAGLLGPLGTLLTWLAWRASKDPIYPVNDPRLGEAAQLVNL